MKRLKLTWSAAGRIRRAAVVLGAVAAVAGGVLMAAAPAQALVGTDPTTGTIVLEGPEGIIPLNTPEPSTDVLSAGTSDGCPSGFQTSAAIYAVDPGPQQTPPLVTNLSGDYNNPVGAALPATTFPLADTVANLFSDVGFNPGQSDEWVISCSSSPSDLGPSVFYQDIIVTLSADGSTYTISVPAAAVNTTTVLSASPNPAGEGASVTLTAAVTDADGSSPAGTVNFFNGSTLINTTPVSVSGGEATTTTTFSSTGSVSLSAQFTPTNTTAYNGSTGAYTESVVASGTQTQGTIPVSVAVPPTGTFSVTIPSVTAVLTVNSAVTQATGDLGAITVTDSRNTYPGFAVYGQETADFAGSGLPSGTTITSIPSDDLGWAPAGTVEGGAVIGASAADIGANAGPATLVSAAAGLGFGADTLNPALTLTIPAGTPIGTYTGGVVITYVEAAP